MRQGEIWLVNLDPAIGAEIKKTRPCVIVNDDSTGILPLKVIAPITEYRDRYENVPWMVILTPNHENCLDKKSVIDLFQVRSVAEERLARPVGTIGRDQLVSVKAALKIVFGC
jgi:mRNA interferase MazF